MESQNIKGRTPSRGSAALRQALVFAGAFVVAFSTLPAHCSEVTLQNSTLAVSFDAQSGALTRLEDKPAHWLIERRPELGDSFRIFAPLPRRRYNFVLGRKQQAVQVEKVSDHQVRFLWKNLLSENGGMLPLTLAATASLTNGILTFEGSLTNNSSLTVDTIDFPYLGDVNPPDRSTPLHAVTLKRRNIKSIDSDEIYPRFGNRKGYWGVFFPTKIFDSKQSLFCLIQSPHNGLYVGIDRPKPPYFLQYTFEQHPGVISSINTLVPQQDEISGHPVHLEFRTCHFVFVPPHSSTNLVPIVFRAYPGGQDAGLDLYKEWRSGPQQHPANP